jgi:ATP-dependent helicase/nuclease subunit B
MTIAVVTSAASRSRHARARAWLEQRAPAEEVLILGTTPASANEIARGVATKKGGAFGWHRLTLAQLAHIIALPELTRRGLAAITQIGMEAVVVRLVDRLRAEGRLGRFAAIAHTPGFPRAVAGVIAELRLARLSPDAVAAAAPDVAPLLAAYETLLAEMALTDWAGVLALAAEDARSHRLAGLPLLMLDVPIATSAELAFLHALAGESAEILATVPTADAPTLERVLVDLDWPIENLDLSSAIRTNGAETTLENLQRNLFRQGAGAAAPRPGAGVEVFSAPGEGRECVEIARRVLARTREGVAFDRIAVLCRSPEGYRTSLEEAFDRAAIPAHFAHGARRPDPAGRAFCALLECAAEGLSARRFAEYLSLAQVPDPAPDGGPPATAPRGDRWVAPEAEAATEETAAEPQPPVADASAAGAGAGEPGAVAAGRLRAPRRWERLLVEAAVIGSHERWRNRLNGLANQLRARLTELGGEDETAAAIVKRTLDDLAAFAGFALPLIDVLGGWPACAGWDEWLDRLGGLATRALRHPDRVLAVVAELAPIAPVGPVSLRGVVDVLSPLLLERAVPPPPQRHGKVFVGPIEAARGLSFDTVFVPGLAERMFPRKIIEEPILLDRLRKEIGGDLATNERRLDGERLALALAVGAAESRVCLSYPRLDLAEQPRPQVPSFYVLEALRASEGRLPDFTELARRAETATAAGLGWPAPADPAEAIDGAEYDLAILERLAAAGRPDAGAARYLIGANPHLARALRARYQRWGGSWTASDGLIGGSAAARAAMARHGLGVRSYSATALQTYARCPYRFFLYAIHRLAPRIEPEAIDELDPLQRGALIHDIQFALFARLRRDGLLPIRPGTLDPAQSALDAVVAAVAARYHDDLAPAIERVWLDGIAAIGADLREWLRRASLDDSGFVPRHFELSFGLPTRAADRSADPRSVPGAVGLDCGIELRGAIDLVESDASGRIRVTDHKTGRCDGKPGQVVAGGTALQPLLYALAAEKIFAGEAATTCGRLYFCTSRGGFAALEVPLDDRARAAARQLAETVGDALAQPFLPARPDKGACEYCDYRTVCGPHEERRTARKPAAPLEPLLALRGAP